MLPSTALQVLSKQEAKRAVGGGVKVAFASLKDSVALEVPEVRKGGAELAPRGVRGEA